MTGRTLRQQAVSEVAGTTFVPLDNLSTRRCPRSVRPESAVGAATVSELNFELISASPGETVILPQGALTMRMW